MNAKYPWYVTVTFDYNVSFVYVYFSIHISVFQYANEAYANEWDKNEKILYLQVYIVALLKILSKSIDHWASYEVFIETCR